MIRTEQLQGKIADGLSHITDFLGHGCGNRLHVYRGRCLGEFGATLTFAGSLEGVTRTLPLEIYLQRETDADAAVALSLVLVVVAVAVVMLVHRRSGPGGAAGLP